MVQALETQMDDGLNVKLQEQYENYSAEQLKRTIKFNEQMFTQKRTEDPEFRLSDSDILELDYLRFLLSKKEGEQEIKVDDLFYGSWGWEQTNIDFVKVVSISPSGKTVKAVSVGQKMIEGSQGYMAESVEPYPEHIISKSPVTLRIEKSSHWNPIAKEHQKVGKIQLRGSYHYSSDGVSKHLGTLYRYESPCYQSHYH